jgi:hypothetical protein
MDLDLPQAPIETSARDIASFVELFREEMLALAGFPF